MLDETWGVSRYAHTAGHASLGLAVVDVRTGEAPSPGRSLLRAVIVSLPLYVLPVGTIVGLMMLGDHPTMLALVVACGALILGFVGYMRLTPAGRGVHDVAARTVVVQVAPPQASEV